MSTSIDIERADKLRKMLAAATAGLPREFDGLECGLVDGPHLAACFERFGDAFDGLTAAITALVDELATGAES